MTILILIPIILVVLYLHYEPKLDRTSEGDIILWYKSGYTRQNFIIWKN